VFNYWKLYRFIQEIQPEIVHLNNLRGFSPIIWQVLKRLQIPVVQTVRDYRFLCVNGTMTHKSKVCLKQCVKCKIYSKINKYASLKIETVVYPSTFMKEFFNKMGLFKTSRNTVIFNTIKYDMEKVHLIAEKKKKRDDKTIKFVFLGALSDYKGLINMLDTFTQIENKNIILNILGRGPLESIVKKYAENDHRILFAGFLEGAQKENVLLDSDVLIAPSIWNEPFGRVVLDAYKYAMPVIGSKFGGIKEILQHYTTGLVIDPTDQADFMSAINHFSERQNIVNCIDNCTILLVEFGINKHIQQYRNEYIKLLKSNNN